MRDRSVVTPENSNSGSTFNVPDTCDIFQKGRYNACAVGAKSRADPGCLKGDPSDGRSDALDLFPRKHVELYAAVGRPEARLEIICGGYELFAVGTKNDMTNPVFVTCKSCDLSSACRVPDPRSLVIGHRFGCHLG